MYARKSMDFVTQIIDQTPNISVITEIEALSWLNPDPRKEGIVQEFIKDANVLTISPLIVACCVGIRRGKRIKTPDSIIAATAIVHDLILVTSDQGFSGIPNLRVIDPVTIKD